MTEESLAEQQSALASRPITRVLVKQGINGAWHVRYRQDEQRKGRRNFATEAAAWAWIDGKIQKYGGTR